MPGGLVCSVPFAELSELGTRFDRVFDELSSGRKRAWTPAIDVARDDGNLVIHAELPGIKPEEAKDRGRRRHRHRLWRASGVRGGEGQALGAARAPLRVVLSLDVAAHWRRRQQDQGEDARRRRRSDDPLPRGGTTLVPPDYCVVKSRGQTARLCTTLAEAAAAMLELAATPAIVSGLTGRRPRSLTDTELRELRTTCSQPPTPRPKRPWTDTRGPPMSPDASRTTTTSAERDRLQQMVTRRAGRGLPAPLDRACCPSRARLPSVASSQTDSRSREEDDDDDNAVRP